jgi:hypothetical protein
MSENSNKRKHCETFCNELNDENNPSSSDNTYSNNKLPKYKEPTHSTDASYIKPQNLTNFRQKRKATNKKICFREPVITISELIDRRNLNGRKDADENSKKTRTTSIQINEFEIEYDKFVACNYKLNYDYASFCLTHDICNAFVKHFESIVRLIARVFTTDNTKYFEKIDEKNIKDHLHQLEIKKKLGFISDQDERDHDQTIIHYNEYNKAIVNPLYAKIFIIQKLATLKPHEWIGSKFGYQIISSSSSSLEDESFIG